MLAPFASEKVGQSLRDSVFVIFCGKDVVDSRCASMKTDSDAGFSCGQNLVLFRYLFTQASALLVLIEHDALTAL